MKKYIIACACAFLVAVAVFIARTPTKAERAKLERALATLPSVDQAKKAVHLETVATVAPTMPASARPDVSKAVATEAFKNAISMSDFFASNEVSHLSDEQLAAMNIVLSAARKTMYALLFERGTLERAQNGELRITIPGKTNDLNVLREYVYNSLEEILGEAQTDGIRKGKLGKQLEAKFAFFGEYDTVIRLSFDGLPDPRDAKYITMRSEYKGPTMSASTSVYRRADFERQIVAIEVLKPKT